MGTKKAPAVGVGVGELDPWRDGVDSHLKFLRRETKLIRGTQSTMQAAQISLQTQLQDHLKSDEDSFVKLHDTMMANGQILRRVDSVLEELRPVITSVQVARKGGRIAALVAGVTSKFGRMVTFCVAVGALLWSLTHGQAWGVAWRSFIEFMAR